MQNIFFTLFITLVAASSLPAQSPTLKVGDPAPALDVEHWIKGDAVTTFQPGQAYVVEFWATWCPPCKDSMPHPSKLQAELGDKVVIIGLSDEALDTAKTFLDKPEWAAKTHYTLGTDPDRSSYADYMEAAKQSGIPTSFLVNGEGNIEWIGHPAGMDGPLFEMLGLGRGEESRGPMVPSIDFEALMNQKFESTPEANAWFAKADAALREDNTLWEFKMTTMITVGMSMDSMESIEMKRVGKVTNGGSHGVRVDAKTIIDFPGMPQPMEEPSWAVLKDGMYYLDRSAPMPMMPSMHGKMSVAEALALKEEFAGPVASPGAAAMFDKNPVYANPAGTLADILAMSSLKVTEDGETEVVLSGTGSSLLDLNAFSAGPEGMAGVAVQLSIDKASGRPTRLVVGKSDSPSFTLSFQAYAELEEIEASLFSINGEDAEWANLAEELRAEMEQMQGMAPEGEGNLINEEF
jgi:thiol-disulfide isomerase/thioredoxin